MSLIAGNVGAVATLGMGALGLFAPARAAAFTNISPIGKMGVSEIRATYGGLFVALGVVCLVLQEPLAFGVAAIAWAGAAGGRAASVFLDRNFAGENLGGIAFELAFAIALAAPLAFA